MIVDVNITEGQAVISSHDTGERLVVVPARYVACRMPGESHASFTADVDEDEVDLMDRVDRVPASRASQR
jgi:hypothetical protein